MTVGGAHGLSIENYLAGFEGTRFVANWMIFHGNLRVEDRGTIRNLL
jgi:hypothetical protein